MISGLIEILKRCLPKDMVIDENFNFVKDSGLDSFGILQLLMEIEVYFKINIPIESLANEKNHKISQLSNIIENILKSKNP